MLFVYHNIRIFVYLILFLAIQQFFLQNILFQGGVHFFHISFYFHSTEFFGLHSLHQFLCHTPSFPVTETKPLIPRSKQPQKKFNFIRNKPQTLHIHHHVQSLEGVSSPIFLGGFKESPPFFLGERKSNEPSCVRGFFSFIICVLPPHYNSRDVPLVSSCLSTSSFSRGMAKFLLRWRGRSTYKVPRKIYLRAGHSSIWWLRHRKGCALGVFRRQSLNDAGFRETMEINEA